MSRYIPSFILFSLTLYFAYLYLQDPVQPILLDPVKDKEGSVSYNQLEQYQKETQIKLSIKRQQGEMNKKIGGPEMQPDAAQKNKFHRTDFNKGIDQRAIDLAGQQTYEAMTLDQRMDQFLAKKQSYDDLEQAQKKAYAEAFIQEAYNMGFDVKINDQLDIVSVEKR